MTDIHISFLSVQATQLIIHQTLKKLNLKKNYLDNYKETERLQVFDVY